MRRTLKTIAVFLAATAAVPASAQDWGDNASGSMSITVIIAPFGAAVAAAAEGAVGAWSVAGRNDGVLLNAPETISNGQVQDISLFNNADAPLSVTSSVSGLTIVSRESADYRGLKRQNFSVGLNNAQADQSVLLVVASI